MSTEFSWRVRKYLDEILDKAEVKRRREFLRLVCFVWTLFSPVTVVLMVEKLLDVVDGLNWMVVFVPVIVAMIVHAVLVWAYHEKPKRDSCLRTDYRN